jgi:hypothetical protein
LSEAETEDVMTRFGLIGAAVLSLTLALAAPAMARDVQKVRSPARVAPVYPHVYVYGDNLPNLPVQDALRWGYGQGYSTYPSGFGGLYGDGRYHGNTISNYHP